MGVKIALYVFIIAGCGLYGILKAQKYGERVKLLEDFVTAAEIIKIELIYRREPLPDLLCRLSHNGKKSGEFFAAVSSGYTESVLSPEALGTYSMEQCWKLGINKVYGSSSLTSEDREIIAELGRMLGTSGIEGQSSIIEGIILRLKNQLTEAENEKKTKGKMQISLGFAAGITIVILLI